MRLSVHWCTERAAWHTENQDRAVIGTEVVVSTPEVRHAVLDPPAVLAVLDGLGGHPAGDVASDRAARVVAAAEPPTEEAAVTALLDAADASLHAAVRDEPAFFGMGTTAALLVVRGDDALVANVGDSSVLTLVGSSLTELTVPDRGLGGALTQCLGAYEGDPLVPHVQRIDVAAGDRFVLASDGLTDVLPADVIEAALEGDSAEAVSKLLSMVDAAGPPDDVTIVVVDVTDG